MSRKNLWILSGPPGSGKTTWAKKQIESAKQKNPEAHIYHFSRDQIRFSLLEEGDPYFSKEELVKKQLLNVTVMALLNWDDCDIFVDATFLSPKVRVGFIKKVLENISTPINVNVVSFQVDLDICLRQNNYRTGRERVPEMVVTRMYYSYKPATKEEYPYKRILVIKNE